MTYKTVKHLAKMADICSRTVAKRIEEMKGSGAYPDSVFFTDPLRVEESAFIHYNTYRQEILNGMKFPGWRES